MSYGTTGFATAVALLMILSPASAGTVHSATVLSPAYTHTVTQSSMSNSIQGCAKEKVGATKWTATSGVISESDAASAKTCGKSLGYVGGYSSAYADGGIEVAIPFKVASSGNHAIDSSWTVNLATSSSYTAGACPAKNVNYNPPLYGYSYGYCEAGANLGFDVYSTVVDLTNNSWYGNYSYADSYNDSYWENYTYCYNYGTPSCSNTSGPFSYSYTYGWNDPGFSAFTWNGATSWSMWNNGTNMVKSHHYVLIVQIYCNAGAFAESANLLGPWAGSGTASLNMATLGNGATLNSVTIT